MVPVGESLAWCELQRQALVLTEVLTQVLMRVLKARAAAVKKQTGWLAPFEPYRVRPRQCRPK